MKVSSKFKKSGNQLYHLVLDNGYTNRTTVGLEKLSVHTGEGNQIAVESSLYYMPGFVMLNEKLNFSNDDTIEFLVEAEHFLISYYYEGNGQILDHHKDTFEVCNTGTIERSYGQHGHLEIGTVNGTQLQRLVFVLSIEYVSELLQYESWAVIEDLFSTRHYYADRAIKDVFYAILAEEFSGLYQRAFFEMKLKELFFFLHTQVRIPDEDRGVPTELYQKLLTAKAYLIINFIEAPTIRQLSRIVALNEYMLKRYFKEVFEITIHSFIIKLRMEEAGRLLNENCTVNEMAMRTGYRSVSHFIATFKKYYGKTPMQASRADHILID